MKSFSSLVVRHSASLVLLAASMILSTGCATAQPALKTAFKDHFLIGVAVNEAQFTGRNTAQVELISMS